MMLDIVRAAGVTVLEIGILALFVPTFGWISLAFWSALTGFALQLSGFEPNAEQSDVALWTLRGLFAGVPFVVNVAGALIFWGFAFNEREHAEVRAELERRASQRES